MKINRLIATLLMLIVVGIAYAATPKYIFYFIGDGMGVGQVQTLRSYFANLPQETQDKITHFYEYPVMGFITTYSASDDITDSAAAGTALATGSKTRNGMIGMDADTVALTSIAKQLKAAGRGVAVMSSVCIDDATPSAFYATRPNRGDYYEIARQGAASGFDILAGAYFRDPYGVRAKTPGNVFAEYEAAGYSVLRGREGYNKTVAESAEKLLWLDNDTTTENRIGYVVDGDNGDMTLPQMVRCGIEFLYKKYPKGFFMMAEGGAIDHMGHGNDPSGVLLETKEFDVAVQVAYEFYKQHPRETLIVVTADHETGGLSLGTELNSTPALNYVHYAQASKGEFGNALRALLKEKGKSVEWNDVRTLISKKTGLCDKIAITAGEEGYLMMIFQRILDNRSKNIRTLYADFDELTNEIFRLYSNKLGMGWTTSHHTGCPVPIFAVGAGSEAFDGKGWLDNTDIPRIIAKVAGIKTVK